jgi:hypothetical protein
MFNAEGIVLRRVLERIARDATMDSWDRERKLVDAVYLILNIDKNKVNNEYQEQKEKGE